MGKLAVERDKPEKQRLNLALDRVTFENLEGIKETHGDLTYTQALKRAIALQKFIDEKKAQGLNIYLANEKGDDVKELLIP